MIVSTQSKNVSETKALGKELAGVIAKGMVIILNGSLAAGKTTLVQSICNALGYSQPVTSPTYTLSNVYETESIRVVHCDFYRLKSDYEVEGLGLDLYNNDSVIIIEWGGSFKELFDNYLEIDIQMSKTGENHRIVTFDTSNLYDNEKLLVESVLLKKVN
jgi:tRNA threonylcarbamoyladenosine biosynthesis protein TsaE